ncbi:MAG: hypothetical protein HOV67_05565 [Kribbellaceae bacterium]|nr:hypothetical protein [Kribbellaceae bacterium]
MSSADVMPQDQPARLSGIDKIERRRIALAESALKTLGELGYARTSLRVIANNSEFTHGVVHYYFRDVVAIDQLLEAMIWRILNRYAELVGGEPAVDAPTAYALVDGLFEQAVVNYADDPTGSSERLVQRVSQVLPKLITT